MLVPLSGEAIQRARAKGVSVIIAAGNSNTYGYGYDNPSAENPDYGVVGSPSTVEESISVASVNDSVCNRRSLYSSRLGRQCRLG